MDMEICFHGTKDKAVADNILKKGFKECCYFARHLEDALEFGGGYIFEVAFPLGETGDDWQFVWPGRIKPDMIVRMKKLAVEKKYENKDLGKKIFEAALKRHDEKMRKIREGRSIEV